MNQIDTEKIKEMTNHKIAYTLYERNENMKKKKLKRVLFSFAICGVLLAGIGTVDAATDGKWSQSIKDTIHAILVDENGQKKELSGETYTDENGDVWIKFKGEVNETEQEVDINKTAIEDEKLDINSKMTEDGLKVEINNSEK